MSIERPSKGARAGARLEQVLKARSEIEQLRITNIYAQKDQPDTKTGETSVNTPEHGGLNLTEGPAREAWTSRK